MRNLVLLGLALASLLGLSACSNGHAEAELGPAKNIGEQAAQNLATIEAEQIERPRTVQVIGSLAADEKSDVASKRQGIIQGVFVERGSVVKKGDVLATLDPTDMINKLREGKAETEEWIVRLGLKSPDQPFDVEQQPDVKDARAAFDLASANIKRSADLRAKNIISQADFDKTQSEFDSTQQKFNLMKKMVSQSYQSYRTSVARLNSLEQAVADTTITAPFAGMISERFVSPGEHVMEGAKVATLVKTNPLRLVLTIPEQNAALATKGQHVEFTVGSRPGEKFDGELTYIGPSLNDVSRSLVAEALVENADGKLKPGFFATARLQFPTGEKSLSLPEGAVKRDGDISKVFIVREGVVHEKIVTIGESAKGRVEITSGLAQKDIVVANAEKAIDGMHVK